MLRREVDTLSRSVEEMSSPGEVHRHAVGDSGVNDLLIAHAARLKEMLPKDAVGGRFDGDEFAVLMTTPDAATAEAAVKAIK